MLGLIRVRFRQFHRSTKMYYTFYSTAIIAFSKNYLWLTITSPMRSGEVYSIQHYVIKFVSDLRLVSGFLHQ